MHRAYHHYHHHQEEEERRDDDGYDEDWDDDVYYAAAARPESARDAHLQADSTGSERATGRDNRTTSGGGGQGGGHGSGGAGGGGARGGGRSGRERATTKGHYMKVPNMRHLRAMRPTPTPAATAAAAGDAFPLVGPFHDLLNSSNQGRDLSSPRASVSTDPGDTPSSSAASLGDGSGGSVPPLGQLTPPSLPPGADGTGAGGAGAGDDDGVATQGTISTSHRTAETPAAVAWPSLGARDNSNNNNNHADMNKAAVRQREGNESSLVHLRGSPRRRRVGRDDANRPSDRPQLGAKMASSSPPSTAAAATGRGQLGPRRPTTSTSSSPAAVAAGVAAGVAPACSAGGGKRKRPASATGGGPGQRFGATAWPKLRGGAPPPPPRRRDPQGGGGGGGVRDTGGLGTASTSRRPAGGRDGEGGERRRLSGAADCSWRSASLHTGSPDAASSRPPSRQGHGNGKGKGKGPALRGDGGGGAGVSVGGGGGGGGTKAAGAATTRGPSLRDRPARWAAKGGGSSVWSPLRAPGAPRGGTGNAGNSHSTKNSTSSCGNAVSGKNSPGKSVSSRFSPSRRGAGLPRAGRGGGDAAASSRSRGGEDGGGEEAPTFELTSVFQATPASSSVSPRPRGSGGHTPGGRWRGSQHPMVRAGQRAGCSSGGAAAAAAAGTPPSFDPTRLAARPRPVGETAEGLQEVEEVEDVGSDDYGEDDGEGFLNSNACEAADGDWGASQEGRGGDGWREADGGAGGGVVDYEDQLLGEEGGGDAAATRLDVRLQQQQQQRLRPSGAAGMEGENPERARAIVPSGGAMDPTGTGGSAEDEPGVEEAVPDSRRLGTLPGKTPGAEAGTATEVVAVSPAAARRPQRVNDTAAEAAATAAAVETPRCSKRRHHEQQAERQGGRQSEPNKDRSSPPPRTPVRPPRTMFAPSSFGRSGPTSSSAAAAAAASTSASTTGGKWRPSFGSAGGARGGGPSPAAGAMHAPRAAFSTPARDRDRDRDRDGVAMPPSGSLGMGATGSASARRRKGSGAGNGPLGRLLQQVRARFDGDEARLLSGEFPFRQPSSASKATTGGNNNSHLDDVGVGGGGSGGKSRRDHGDPRTRCSVALDATVLLPAATPRGPSVGFEGGLWGGGEGNELGQAGGGGASGLVRFSCFVHHVVDVSLGLGGSRVSPGCRRATSAAGDAAGPSGVVTDFGRLHRLEGVHVDGLFKQDTRRAVDVGPGSQLRIYDPCCVWYDAEVGGEGGRAEALLVCTQLCEPYPSCLPALPSPPPPPPTGGGSSSHEGGGGEGSRTTGTAATSALT